MNAMVQRLALSVGILVITVCSLRSQQLAVDLDDLDYSALPRVLFTVCVSNYDSASHKLSSSNFQLYENGAPRQITVRCPEAGQDNSVMLVIDNSGSISPVLGKIKEAAAVLVDSLRPMDESGLLTFSWNVTLQQDFTTNKSQVKNALLGMLADGPTPLYDASYEAVRRLSSRSAKRFAVILTDGENTVNQIPPPNSITPDSVVFAANRSDVRLFTIGFGISADTNAVAAMQRMAYGTGGLYFALERPSELVDVYRKIAALITEPCCVGEFITEDCTDSVRTLVLQATVGTSSASDAETMRTPFRASIYTLGVIVPEELKPLESGTGYITIDPVPDPGLEFTLTVAVSYDDDLLDITPTYPQTLGTIAQNQSVKMRRLGPGIMEFEFARIRPFPGTNFLVGFPIQALAVDSSRTVPFTVEALDDNISGCLTSFVSLDDSVLICKCLDALHLQVDSLYFASSSERTTRVPITIKGGLKAGIGALLTMKLSTFEPIDGVTFEDGDLFAPGTLTFTLNGTELEIASNKFVFPRDTSGILAYLRIPLQPETSPKEYRINLLESTLLHVCCPGTDTLPDFVILQDGICDKIVRRKPGAIVRVTPNPSIPAQGQSPIAEISVPPELDGIPFNLTVVDLQGRERMLVHQGPLAKGRHVLPIKAAELPAGNYRLLLTSASGMASAAMQVLR